MPLNGMGGCAPVGRGQRLGDNACPRTGVPAGRPGAFLRKAGSAPLKGVLPHFPRRGKWPGRPGWAEALAAVSYLKSNGMCKKEEQA